MQVTTVVQPADGISWWLESLRLSLPLVTALIGAWLGGAIALGRFKKERGFDRRLDWYERTFRELNALGWTLNTVVHYYKRERAAEAEALYSASYDELTKFVLTLAEAELYATTEGAIAVRRLIDEINATGEQVHRARKEGVPVTEAAARTFGELVDRACDALARDARKVLNLEALPRRSLAHSP